MIEISSIQHTIGNALILKEISTLLPKGQITALVGPNGAGKSTLLSLISRLRDLQSGSISIDGLDVSGTSSTELAKKLAILTQSNTITSRLTLRDFVSFGRFPHHKGRPTANDHKKVSETLDVFELTDLAPRFLDELSGGQRQKAFVAMTYAQDTDYLLLDEPLNNLDMASSRALMQQLQFLAHRTGKTIIIVLHEINYAASYADWIVGLREGQLVASGPADKILTSQTIEDIFGIKVEIHQIGDKKVVMHYS
jgi:iron complex transport system ATP-binding protein